MRRVAILGAGGAGKSELARALSERTGLPVVYLDVLYWRPGWTAPPPEEFRAALAFVRDLYASGVYHPDSPNYNGTSVKQNFIAGKYAMITTGWFSYQGEFWDPWLRLNPPWWYWLLSDAIGLYRAWRMKEEVLLADHHIDHYLETLLRAEAAV